MTQETLTLEKHIKKATYYANFISAFIATIVALGVGYGFYYNTRSSLERNSQDIKEVQSDILTIQTDVQEVDVFKGISEFEVKALNEKINKIENDVSKMDEKLDKILMQTK
jgi:uncharacterized protein HemX